MARPTFSFQVDVVGLQELQRVLSQPVQLYGDVWRAGITRLASQAGLSAQRGAPVYTGLAKRGVVVGRLQGSIRAVVQNRPIPQWAAVRVRARNKGYPYPRLLEFSPKHQHASWFLRALQVAWRGADRVLNDIGEQIAHNWASR